MPDESALPILDHDLADDEVAWARAVYADFAALRGSPPGSALDPKEVLRQVLSQDRHRLPQPMDVSGQGPWRGMNRHGRIVAAVFLPKAELHRHMHSRTDQFAMYVRGEADAFSLDDQGHPVLRPVQGGDHFHNPPGAPHAFLPKAGQPVPDGWEIGFIAITPRNLREDTQDVPASVRAVCEQAAGRVIPA